ncbi:hypothetical protein HC256_004727 [Beauveria bassiana]|nr:hypothetical protein HC256_004727 [Beauveria bassiana]
MTVVLPSGAESNMSKADRSPGEQSCETRESEQPIKNDGTRRSQANESKETESNEDQNREQRTTGSVDIAKDLRRVSLLRKGSKRAGASINARNTNRKDGDKNDNVHKMIESFQERRVFRVNQEADKEETKDIEEGNSPKDLLDGAGKSANGIARFRSGQTNQFSTGEGKGGGDKDRAKALEPVLESTRVIPELGSLILAVRAALWAATEHQNETDDHEDNSGSKLERRSPELFLSIPKSAKDVDDDDKKQEDNNPHSKGCIFIPILLPRRSR